MLASDSPFVNGNCSAFYGFFPAATLGFTPVDNAGYAIDGWATQQNRIRYAVSDVSITPPGGTAVTNPFTRTNGIRDATAGAVAAASLFFICASSAPSNIVGVHCGPGALNTGGSVPLTSNTPAVVWSVGASAGGRSNDENQNPNPGPDGASSIDRIFVSRTLNTFAGQEFDDIVTWVSVPNLVSRMVLGGQLP